MSCVSFPPPFSLKQIPNVGAKEKESTDLSGKVRPREKRSRVFQPNRRQQQHGRFRAFQLKYTDRFGWGKVLASDGKPN